MKCYCLVPQIVQLVKRMVTLYGWLRYSHFMDSLVRIVSLLFLSYCNLTFFMRLIDRLRIFARNFV